ncbi:hydrogenase expression/formation C-terminal domain-containing protein [Sagittula sp. S175]|uniref:hydrogenase expression/formation C-terminal domain-containing protein n=1 Tax=Sagittula sp. S175 TaxID=3415129 RepID=UPI003C7AF863
MTRHVARPGTGNVPLLLNEIRHALTRLRDEGAPTTLDLTGIPMMPEDTHAFDASLGQGEVRAVVDAGGESEVQETGFAGVWRITHRNADGAVLARHIEVTHVPDILKSQPVDIAAGLERLAVRLAADLAPDLVADLTEDLDRPEEVS